MGTAARARRRGAIALQGVYRAELSTAAVFWLVFAIALAVPIALLFRVAIPEKWHRNGTFASVAVLTLGVHTFATKGFRPDTFDFWLAVVTVSVMTVAFVWRRFRPRQA